MKYLDTSAFLKLVILEQHSEALAAAVEGNELWSSTMLSVEAHRAALRLGVPANEVDALLDQVSLVLPAASTFRTAQSIGSTDLRTLDALHLAAALEIGSEVESIVTYDKRLAVGAAALGVPVTSPGQHDGWWSS